MTHPQRHRATRWVLFGGTVALFAMPAAIAMWRFSPAVLTEDGSFLGTGDIVIIEPTRWVGQPLPILAHVDIAEQLARGSWILVFYRQGCEKCDFVLSKYTRWAAESADDAKAARVAFVEMAVSSTAERPIRVASAAPGIVTGSFRDSRRWFCKTPSIVHLSDGLVTAVESAP